jgi:hypothetical protein
LFGTDQVLLYNVKPWSQLGFGVPNFADKTHTVNRHLLKLADEIGRLQLYIMTHVDVIRTRPPSRNTIERLGKLCNRIQAVLLGRETPYDQNRTEPGHGQPAPRPWNIHPVPYFQGPIVKNGWLAEYNEYCMFALANIFQHTENDLTLTITPEASGDIWQYFREVRNLLAYELLGLSPSEVNADGFKFEQSHYQNYNPTELTVRIESIDQPVDPKLRFTEQDLAEFVRGIPANLILPNLARYPHTTAENDYEGPKQDDFRPEDAAPGVNEGNLDPVI